MPRNLDALAAGGFEDCMSAPFSQEPAAFLLKRLENLLPGEAHAMCRIISFANSLVFTFFASCISRSKS